MRIIRLIKDLHHRHFSHVCEYTMNIITKYIILHITSSEYHKKYEIKMEHMGLIYLLKFVKFCHLSLAWYKINNYVCAGLDKTLLIEIPKV